jgi:deoxyhypusine synthase
MFLEFPHSGLTFHQVDMIVTSCGGIEEDFIKCMAPLFHGDFALSGEGLRRKGVNRIGNLLIPNDHYALLENWMLPLLDKCLEKQKSKGKIWTPSKLIKLMGKEINNEQSVYYWCWKVCPPHPLVFSVFDFCLE